MGKEHGMELVDACRGIVAAINNNKARGNEGRRRRRRRRRSNRATQRRRLVQESDVPGWRKGVGRQLGRGGRRFELADGIA
jgi:hypothetical protein